MFKKKPNIKPFSPLKSSERRRIADQLISDLSINVPPDNEGDQDDKTTTAPGRTSVRNSLLPDSALSARFTTTTGSTLQQVSGAIYVGAHDGQEQRILWAKLDNKLYPTVYTLWHNPGIIPLLHTPPLAVESIQRGSDLMTPGLAMGPPFPEQARKGSLVAIASTEAPSVPIAVGICEIDVNALQSVQGAKGHAVKIMHWYGDELWAWSASSSSGKEPPDLLDGWLKDNHRAAELTQQNEHLDVNDTGDGGVALPEQHPVSDSLQSGDEQALSEDNTIIDVVADRELTTQEIDEAFRKAFLYGVRHQMDINKTQPHFGLEFPLSQSFVMATLVQPFLPTYSPAQTASLQIKRSSWKNIKKFVKYLDKQQIIKSKDQNGNEVVILDIDFDDENIRDFVPYRLPKKEGVMVTGRSERPIGTTNFSDPSVGQKLQRVELHRPKERLQSMFTASGADTRGLYTAADIRGIITSFIEKEELISPNNKRLVKINPLLADALFDGSHTQDQTILAKGVIARDALADQVLRACNPFYAILRNDEQVASAKPKAGAPPKIAIVLETRGGNKTVTKVSGLEPYSIAPQPLADELRRACAGSTSVEQLKGSSPKAPVMEIMIQGPQKDAVTKALEKRGINKQWVDVVDKTKGKKK